MTKNKAGRKPIDDKKIPLTIYVRQSLIQAVGGMDQAKIRALMAIENPEKF